MGCLVNFSYDIIACFQYISIQSYLLVFLLFIVFLSPLVRRYTNTIYPKLGESDIDIKDWSISTLIC